MTDDQNTLLQSRLDKNLQYLKLPFIRDNYEKLAAQASQKHWPHVDLPDKLIDQEAAARRDRAIQRRIRLARFPVIKTIDQFNWNWPKKINRLQKGVKKYAPFF